jgi:hypothetical protein
MTVAARCRGCACVVQPPEGVVCYQPAADSDPGPIVTAVAVYGTSPEVARSVRQADSGWAVDGPGIITEDVPVCVPWSRVGLCPSSGVSRLVVAVHRTGDGQWVSGVAPDSVRDALHRLAHPHSVVSTATGYEVRRGGATSGDSGERRHRCDETP